MSSLITTVIMAQERGSINGINYSWGNGRATVEKQSENIMNLTANIPETIKDWEDGESIHIVDSIVDEAFKESNLMYLTMPKTILRLNYACFSDCAKLQYATIPDSLLSIGANSFYGTKKLRSINFPSTIEIIGDSCFYGSGYYSEVKLGEKVTYIGKASFANCKYIPSIKIFGEIDSLRECTFYGCSTLSSFRWPTGIKYIGSGCFAGCTSLKDLHLPSSLIALEDSCFANCSNLTKIYCQWKNINDIKVSDDAFKNLPVSAVLFVPKGFVDVYKNKAPWDKFNKIEEYEYTDIAKVECIDSGVSVKWASCNVGVSSSSGYGDKLSWGEWYPKDNYNWNTYNYCKDGNWYGGIIDIGSDISGTEYDVAHEIWGDEWRMPTKKEAEELVNNCKWEWTFDNGIPGMRVTGYNGNSIFLPSSEIGSTSANYWTSSLSEWWYSAITFGFNNTSPYISQLNKYEGKFVRPIKPQWEHTKYLSIDVSGSGIASLGGVEIANGKKYFNIDDNYTPIIDFHPNTGEWVLKLFVNNEDVTPNISNGKYTMNTNLDSTFVKIEFSNCIAPSDATDLGLSVLWANCNLGADSPEGAGRNYSWGAVQSVPNMDWNDYYCSEYECGTEYDPVYAAGLFETMDIASSDFDQAHVLLGAGWKLPSNDEFQELIDKCEWERTTIKGINGFKITGLNGNSIFLPDNGYGMPGGHGYSDYNGGGYYWSSSIASKTKGGTLHFVAPNSKTITSNVRCYAQHIRPVFKQTNPSLGIKHHFMNDSESDVRYYNINGIEINKPTKGLYIVRSSNGQSYKVIIK